METLAATRTESWLSWFLRGILLLGFIILIARLFELQIIKGDYFRLLAEGNRIRRIPITAARGKISARGGEVLVGNVEVKRKIVFNKDSGYSKAEDITGASEEDIVTEWKRDYPLGEAFAHLGGYLGEVSPEEVGKINPECPEKGPRLSGQLVGRSGLEQEYECTLAGIDGEELVEVDTQGNKVRILGRKEPTAGQDLKTSIAFGLQKKVAQTLSGKSGAAVVTDATGEVLALYSSPAFNPENPAEALDNPDLPLFNRAIGGQYHPGSVFKPVVAIASLEEGKIDKNYTFEDTGKITVDSPYGSFSYTNWYYNQYGGTEGDIGLVRAIARSTDTFFYKLGEIVGIDKLGFWMQKMGLATRVNIDLPGEILSLIPSPEWKLKVKGEQWFLGNTYHLSIGQGDIALTVVGLHRALLAIANDGVLCELGIAKDPRCSNLKLDKKNIELVRQGMIEACSAGGTGYTFFDVTPQVGCKTGTAETNEDGKTHAWFSVFAPSEFPELMATIMIERSGEGSKVAGPLARDIFDYWFHP